SVARLPYPDQPKADGSFANGASRSRWSATVPERSVAALRQEQRVRRVNGLSVRTRCGWSSTQPRSNGFGMHGWTCLARCLVYLWPTMIGNDLNKMGWQVFPLLARTSGFVTSGQALATPEEGFVMVLLWGLLGAF